MKDKVVVITGASAGVGAAVAEALAKRGARVVLVARREKELGEVARRGGENALAIVADVTVRSEHKRVFDQAVARFGGVDVWINNAGRGISRAVSELTDEDIDAMVQMNVKSVLYGMQTVLPHFKERKRGHIINISSMLGRVPFAPFRSAYSASKAAMNSLSANLRMELRASYPDIHVTCVHLPVVRTDFGKNALYGGPDSRELPNSQSAEEVAEVVAGVIESPRADVYARPGAQQMVLGYYGAEDMGAVESKFGGR